MPRLYLATPTHSGEEYPNGGDERFWINKIADSTQRRLVTAGVTVLRSGKAAVSPNKSPCDLYVSVGSHTAPKEAAATLKGIDVCYFEQGEKSRHAAEVFTAALRAVYPEPDLAGVRPMGGRPKALDKGVPAVLIKLAYHDNPQDEAWLVNSVEPIAQALSCAAAECLEVPLEID